MAREFSRAEHARARAERGGADRRRAGSAGRRVAPRAERAAPAALPSGGVVAIAGQLGLVDVLGVRRLLRQGRIVLVGVADLLLEALVARDVVGAGNTSGVVGHVVLLPLVPCPRRARTG